MTFDKDLYLANSSKLAEQGVLAYILEYPEASDYMLRSLSSRAFVDPDHQKIFKAIMSLRKRNQLPSTRIVAIECGLLGSDLTDYLVKMSACAPAQFEAESYRSTIVDLFKRRELLNIDSLVVDAVANRNVTYDKAFGVVASKLSDLMLSDKGAVSFRSAGENFVQQLLRSGEILSTGMPMLDAEIVGIEPHALTILGGGTGVGKTTFALSMAFNIALQGVGALYVSLEIPEEDLAQRIIPMLSNDIKYSDLRKREVDPLVIERVNEVQDLMSKVPIYFLSGVYNINNILAHIKHQKTINNVRICFIDHLQLLAGGIKYEELAVITATIKEFCLTEKIPVVVVSQLNNGFQKRPDKDPVESDLRGSGTIAQDADVIVALYKVSEDDPHTYLKVLKNRKAESNNKVFFKTALDIDTRAYTLAEKVPRPKPVKPPEEDKPPKSKKTWYEKDED